VSAAFSSLFYALERMEYPALIAVVTNLVRISFQAIVLLAGFGIVGMASVSLGANVVSAALFLVLALRLFGRLRPSMPRGLIREMLGTSFPLMLNHLLASIFFKIDSVMLQWQFGSTVLGYYGAAYKFIDGMLMIPSSVTFALFPMFSRRAGSDPAALKTAFVLTARVLLILSLPIAVITTALGDFLVLVLGGTQYLPHSAIALKVLIWFLPFSFVNGLTQYVLIAINRQRLITISFFVATTFNILANLYAIPRYSYVGAGVVTILSELALMVPFYYWLRRDLGPLPLAALIVRPAVAGVGMGVFLLLAGTTSLLLTVPASLVMYGCLLLMTRAITPLEARSLAGWARSRIGRRAAAAVESRL
jgi:O-antigen/teichoic acid export membrane protein